MIGKNSEYIKNPNRMFPNLKFLDRWNSDDFLSQLNSRLDHMIQVSFPWQAFNFYLEIGGYYELLVTISVLSCVHFLWLSWGYHDIYLSIYLSIYTLCMSIHSRHHFPSMNLVFPRWVTLITPYMILFSNITQFHELILYVIKVWM